MPSYMAPILKAKESGIPFRKMSNDELLLSAYSLIVKMNVITGWAILDKKLLDIFAEQLSFKLCETYAFLNQNEIEYAFRTYSVNDWGKNFNLNALDEVLRPYLTLRRELHINETKSQISLPMASQEISQKEMIQDVEEYLAKDGLEINLIPIFIYEYAEKLGYINLSRDEKISIYEEAKTYRQRELSSNAKSNRIDDIMANNMFFEMVKKNEITDEEKFRLQNLSKKIAFKKFYESKKDRPA
jgi:hypothetical protein